MVIPKSRGTGTLATNTTTIDSPTEEEKLVVGSLSSSTSLKIFSSPPCLTRMSMLDDESSVILLPPSSYNNDYTSVSTTAHDDDDDDVGYEQDIIDEIHDSLRLRDFHQLQQQQTDREDGRKEGKATATRTKTTLQVFDPIRIKSSLFSPSRKIDGKHNSDGSATVNDIFNSVTTILNDVQIGTKRIIIGSSEFEGKTRRKRIKEGTVSIASLSSSSRKLLKRIKKKTKKTKVNQNRNSSTKSVTFAGSDTIYEIEHYRSHVEEENSIPVRRQDIWYTNEEYDSMKHRAIMEANATEKCTITEPATSTRNRIEYKTKIRHLVYDEEENQRVQKGKVYDPESIRDIYQRASSESIQRAIENALQNEIVANTYLQRR